MQAVHRTLGDCWFKHDPSRSVACACRPETFWQIPLFHVLFFGNLISSLNLLFRKVSTLLHLDKHLTVTCASHKRMVHHALIYAICCASPPL